MVLVKFRKGIGLGAKALGFIARHAGAFNTVLRPLLWVIDRFGWLIGPFLVKKLLGIRGPMTITRGIFYALSLPIRILVRLIGALVRAFDLLNQKFKIFDRISSAASDVGGFLSRNTLGKLSPGNLFHAAGGTIAPGGFGIVGEAGPELATVGGGGARITPLSRGGGDTSALGKGIHVHSHITVNLDGRPIARSTADQMADWRARKGQNA